MIEPMGFFVLTLVLVLAIMLVVGGIAALDHVYTYGKTWQFRAVFVGFVLTALAAVAIAVAWMYVMANLVTGLV